MGLKTANKTWATYFGNLKVRPKLMVLHNLFFLVLSASVYLVVYPDLGARASVNLIVVLADDLHSGGGGVGSGNHAAVCVPAAEADAGCRSATQQGDREHEMIDERLILGDEIGQIMRSRNETMLQLRHNEEALEEALRKLEAQDRLVSLGLLAASVAHELNTPLTVLQGSVEKLAETTADGRRRSACSECCG